MARSQLASFFVLLAASGLAHRLEVGVSEAQKLEIGDLARKAASPNTGELPRMPNILSAEGRQMYSTKFFGWGYSDKISGISNVYGSKREAYFGNLKLWTDKLKELETMEDATYEKNLVWFEDTGRTQLSKIQEIADGDCESGRYRCRLSDSHQLCTRKFDDPSPWCELRGHPSELSGKMCSDTSEEAPIQTKKYNWSEVVQSFNGKRFGITSEGCLAEMSTKSYTGAIEVKKYPMPTLEARMRSPDVFNTMPIRHTDGDWTSIELPISGVRTGVAGKGQLGRWGPNFAADPVITRELGGKNQVALITRTDSGLLAIPGGMLEPGDSVTKTILKEFIEEAMGNVGDFQPDNPKSVETLINECRSKAGEGNKLTSYSCDFMALIIGCVDKAVTLYEGVVDDPRNTDNAWMETSAKWIHCNSCEQPEGVDRTVDEICEHATLSPSTDASKADWVDVAALNLGKDTERLYASHGYILQGLMKDTDFMENVKLGGSANLNGLHHGVLVFVLLYSYFSLL